jgi:hypothetical protein
MQVPKNHADDKPYCFGKLESVFPLGKDGLRHTPETCMTCRTKTECLRTAMRGKEGITVREEVLDRAYAAGVMGFLERWSRKKYLHRLKHKSP